LAEHYLQAQVWDKAVTYLVQTAAQKERNYAYQMALADYEQALHILETYAPFVSPQYDELRFDILLARQKLLWATGQAGRQEKELELLLYLAKQLNSTQHQAEALNAQARYCILQDNYSRAIKVAKEVLALAEAHALPAPISQIAWRRLGVACVWSGRYKEAEAALLQSRALCQEDEVAALPDFWQRTADVYYNLARTYFHLGDMAQFEAVCQAFQERAESDKDPWAMMMVYDLLGKLASSEGDWAANRHYMHLSLKFSRNTGISGFEAMALLNLGNAFHYELLDGEAIANTNQALALFRQLGDQYGVLEALANLGSSYMAIGQTEAAYNVLTKGVALAKTNKIPRVEGRILILLGSLHLEQGRIDAASSYLSEAERIVQEVEESFKLYYSMGRVNYVGDEIQEAIHYFQQAYMDAKDYLPGLATLCLSYIALCHLRKGAIKEAEQKSKQAFAIIESDKNDKYKKTIYFHHWQIMLAIDQKDQANQALVKAYELLQAQKETLPDPDWQRAFLENIPVNREIAAAYANLQAQIQAGQITVQLPDFNAPHRGLVPPDQMVSVTWTIQHPSDEAIRGKKARRHHCLLRLFKEAEAQGAISTVKSLANALGVSEKTIRRDLAALRQKDQLLLTRGSLSRK
jgi:tetratricopeptide (TPR) repeat protein